MTFMHYVLSLDENSASIGQIQGSVQVAILEESILTSNPDETRSFPTE